LVSSVTGQLALLTAICNVRQCRPGDVLEGEVTKVVTFGAFVEILPGVEGLVHISELADHHVENPSEVVEPGTSLNVKILEIDEERRRLSLSIKRVEGQNMPMQDLGDQIAEASASGDLSDADADAPDAPDADAAAADAEADEAPEAEEPEAPAEETPAEEVEPAADAEAEPAAAETPEEAGGDDAAEQPAEEDDGSEAQEGESVIERPDAPDGDEQADDEAGQD